MNTRPEIDLTESEKNFISDFYRMRGSNLENLEHDLHVWESFSSRLEGGYGLHQCDWVNSLDYRNVLGELIQKGPEGARIKIATVVEEIDEKFFAATQPTKRDLPWAANYHFAKWAVRVPLKFNDQDFKNYLESNGYL